MVRVRIAPSPTGEPHVGNMRTFLFNWLFARQNKGKFVVRIEDTDQKRYQPGSEVAILEGLRWLGLDWDEGPDIGGPFGPYVQSERQAIYQEYAQKLLETGVGYYCFCSTERLDEMRKKQQACGQAPRYDKSCCALSAEEAKKRVEAGEPHVIRLRVPEAGEIAWDDLIHGKISFTCDCIDDQILIKSDGFPTYHFAVVVDDHLMQISHVLRADEWISSTPKQLLLYKAFGWEPPIFGHLPMVLGPDRAKLSKRHGATSILDFREQGYLPETMANFLALLGWSYDDKTEIFSREELLQKFDLKKINPTNPIFDFQKLEWMNGSYLRALKLEDLAKRLKLKDKRWEEVGDEYFNKVVALFQERLKTLTDFTPLSEYFFTEQVKLDEKRIATLGVSPEDRKKIFGQVAKLLTEIPEAEWSAARLESDLRSFCKKENRTPKEVLGLLREVLTGQPATPPLFGVMEVLGKERVLRRLSW